MWFSALLREVNIEAIIVHFLVFSLNQYNTKLKNASTTGNKNSVMMNRKLIITNLKD